MKQLFVNGKATVLFFNSTASYDDIFEWVHEKVMFSEDNIFNLNEQHSCSVNSSDEGILICGDEDCVKIVIENIVPIL